MRARFPLYLAVQQYINGESKSQVRASNSVSSSIQYLDLEEHPQLFRSGC
ncbi:hypothetical protein CsatB_024633 [Cannabis sativa]